MKADPTPLLFHQSVYRRFQEISDHSNPLSTFRLLSKSLVMRIKIVVQTVV
jgi:hypothetical protein